MENRSEVIANVFSQLTPHLDERSRRLVVAAAAIAIGRGGVTIMHESTGLAMSTILRGQRELTGDAVESSPPMDESSLIPEVPFGDEQHCSSPESPLETGLVSGGRIRRPGGGRKKLEVSQPGLVDALEKLVDPFTRGDPETSTLWVIKSTKTLSAELKSQGFKISPSTVGRILKETGYSLQSNKKIISGSQHPDRNAQFLYIDDQIKTNINENNPVISIDTKKKEILGLYYNKGKRYEKSGQGTAVLDHDFPSPDLPRAFPYGIYDVKNNTGHVVIGVDHDTSEFAANSIFGWWEDHGKNLYSDAQKIFITADCGGSNSNRTNLWKYNIQKLANKINLPIQISHLPPGTSKWNKIEHRLFSFITSNWRGHPLIDYETVVNLISNTKTISGLSVTCILDQKSYQKGIKLSKEEILSIKIFKNEFHGEWNYIIYPNI